MLDTTEVEAQLWRRLWAGDMAAEGELYALHENLVRMIAGKSFSSIQRNDPDRYENLKQRGRLALLKAIRKFKPAKGAFSGYANRTIWGEMMKEWRSGEKGGSDVSLDAPDDEGEIAEIGAEELDPLNTLTVAERSLAEHLVSSLRPLPKAVFRGRAERCMDSRAVAVRLGISSLQVDGIYRKAQTKLRRKMAIPLTCLNADSSPEQFDYSRPPIRVRFHLDPVTKKALGQWAGRRAVTEGEAIRWLVSEYLGA